MSRETIILEGFLKKKSPKAFLGRHPWQDRYFVLWPDQLCYYKRREDVGNEALCLGFLLVENMGGVATMMADKAPSRFNLLLEGVQRQFELNASSEAAARQWVDAIRDVLRRYGKKPVSLAPPASPVGASAAGAGGESSKFWKPKVHRKLLMQRRAAISAETGAFPLMTDAKLLAARRYEKSPEVFDVLYRAVRGSLAFRIMDDEALRQVVAVMWQQDLAKGEVLVAEGQPAYLFSVVISGALDAVSTASPPQGGLAPLDIHAEYAAAGPASPSSMLATPSAMGAPWNAPAGAGSGPGGKYATLSVSTLNAAGGPSAPASPMGAGPSAPAQTVLARGQSWGELALLYDSVATHTVTARDAASLYCIDRAQYKRLIAVASERRFAQRVAFLQTTELLGQLPERLLKQVAEALEERFFGAGETIINEGEAGDSFYIIVSGRARALVGGKEVHVFDRPGEYFGERALVKKEQRGATIVADTGVSVLYLTRADFVDLMGRVEEQTDRATGVRKYSLLNRELAVAATLTSPTASHAAALGGFSFDASAPAAGGAVSTEDDVLPPPPPADDGTAGAAAGAGAASPLKNIRMHFGAAAAEPEATAEEAAAKQAAAASSKRAECRVQSLSDLRIIGTLGRGTFGHVQLVADSAEQTYALKAVSKAHIARHNQIPHILNERAVMMALDHPFVVKLHRTLRDKSHLYFLLEPSMGGELFSVLRARDRFDAPTAQFYAGIVTLVFGYLHGKDTLYRDLKPENLLMDNDGYLRVTDFGFAKQTRDRTYTFCGTPDYLAPEIVASAGHHTGADWWTLGVLVYEMLAGYTPFYDEAGPTQMYSKILAGKVHYPAGFSDAAQDLVASLLQIKPTRRLGVLLGGAENVKRHAWFAGLDWNALMRKELTAPIPMPSKDPFDLSNFDQYPAEPEEDEEPYEADPANPDWDAVF